MTRGFFVDEVERRLKGAPAVTRFAPSPTGYLHLGHVASAVHVWGLGRALGARVLLRIEDHDRGRSRPEYEQALFADLAWLGLVHDNSELTYGVPSPYRQSEATAYYEQTLARLGSKAQLYACDCSRRLIATAGEDRQATDPGRDQADADATAELRYSGRCRTRGLALGTPGTGLRLVTPAGAACFVDLLLGEQVQEPARQCGDLLLKDRHGNYTYQFAVVADDLRHGVNLVVRGQDLTSSTGRQIQLARLLGRTEEPLFLHHPLLRDTAGRKLGKRFYAAAIAKRRDNGESPEYVLGEAAYLVGLQSEPRPLTAEMLPELYKNRREQWTPR